MCLPATVQVLYTITHIYIIFRFMVTSMPTLHGRRTRLEMNLIVVKNAQPQTSDAGPHFSIGGLILLAKPPWREQGLQKPMQILGVRFEFP